MKKLLMLLCFSAFFCGIEAGSAGKRFLNSVQGRFGAGKKVFGNVGAFLGTLGLLGFVVGDAANNYDLSVGGFVSIFAGGACGVIALLSGVGEKISQKIASPHRLPLLRAKLPGTLGRVTTLGLGAGALWGIWRMRDQPKENKKS